MADAMGDDAPPQGFYTIRIPKSKKEGSIFNVKDIVDRDAKLVIALKVPPGAVPGMLVNFTIPPPEYEEEEPPAFKEEEQEVKETGLLGAAKKIWNVTKKAVTDATEQVKKELKRRRKNHVTGTIIDTPVDFENYDDLKIKTVGRQSSCGCCCCMKLNRLSYISEGAATGAILYRLLEEQSGCACCPTGRATLYEARPIGPDKPQNNVIASFDRQFACCAFPLKCCCSQRIVVRDDDGSPLGSVRENCYCCVPSYSVYAHGGTHQHNIRPSLCCFGCCVNIFDGGCLCCKQMINCYITVASEGWSERVLVGNVPTTRMVYNTANTIIADTSGLYQSIDLNEDPIAVGESKGELRKVPRRDNFEIHYPKNISRDEKIRLLGGLVLMHSVYFTPPVRFFSLPLGLFCECY
mmetsp:Transcript_14225/g.21609  ORF Transcript_14225/g.21609 Transcript_14225/m.21609 type:complete len:408 (+) Transcript_14225:3-1226(+)